MPYLYVKIIKNYFFIALCRFVCKYNNKIATFNPDLPAPASLPAGRRGASGG